jgi:hypothetical protein
MQYSYMTLALLCLTEQVSMVASKLTLRDATHGQISHEAYLSSKLRRRADIALRNPDLVEREALPKPAHALAAYDVSESGRALTFGSLKAATPEPSNNDTQNACTEKLKLLNGKPSNPSGMSMCYNIAAFDNSTGDFQAHVLIYQIGAATGKWVGIKQDAADSIGLQYLGATTKQKPTVKRDVEDKKLGARADAPKLMSDLTFVGKVNKEWMPMLSNLYVPDESYILFTCVQG